MNKKYIALFTSALILGTLTTNLSVTATGYKNYDVNGDNQINFIDVIEVKKAVLNGETVPPQTSTTSYRVTSNSSTTTRLTTTTRATTRLTTRATTTWTTTNWTTILDDDTINAVKQKYEILANDYLKNKEPSLYNDMVGKNIELLKYDGLHVVKNTTTTTQMTSTPQLTTVATRSVYDCRVTIHFSRAINENEKDTFPNAWLYNRSYVTLYFSNGTVARVE